MKYQLNIKYHKRVNAKKTLNTKNGKYQKNILWFISSHFLWVGESLIGLNVTFDLKLAFDLSVTFDLND